MNYGSKNDGPDYRKSLRRRKVMEREALSALQALVREVEYSAERGEAVPLDRIEYLDAKRVLDNFKNSIPR